VAIGVTVSAAVIAGSMVGASPALAQTDDTAQTEANIEVQEGITITVDADFTIAGPAGAIATTTVPVEFTVTNNEGGFTVDVLADTANLEPVDPLTNPDVIPFTDLEIDSIDAAAFVPLSSVTPVTIYTSLVAAPTGDTQATDYQIDMPFVTPDTYSGTITYTATVTP
jgi:hypothetical protein